MQEKKRKILLICLEVLLLSVISPLVYWGAFRLLFDPINCFMGDWFFTPLGVIGVLFLDIVWIVTVKTLPIKNLKIKVVLIALVLILSASVLTCQVILTSLGDMMW